MTPTFHRLAALSSRIDSALTEFAWQPKTRKYVIPNIGGIKVGAVISRPLPADSYSGAAQAAAHANSIARLSIFHKPASGGDVRVYGHHHVQRPSDVGRVLKEVRGDFGGGDPRRNPRSQWRKMRPDEEFKSRLATVTLSRFPLAGSPRRATPGFHPS